MKILPAVERWPIATPRRLNEASDNTLKISHEIIVIQRNRSSSEKPKGADLIIIVSRGLGAWNRLLKVNG